MSYEDQTLTCRDCGASFAFTASEQEFYASKGFVHPPSRCPACRAARKGSRDGGMGGGMVRDRQPREMFTVTCSRCGNEAQVPFQPHTDKPVYCSDCFAVERGRSGGRAGDLQR